MPGPTNIKGHYKQGRSLDSYMGFFSPLFPLEFPIFDSTAVEVLISDSFHTSSEI